jgi:uncharacterized membrane protein
VAGARDFDSGLSYVIGMTAVTLLLDWPLAMLVGLITQLGLLALTGSYRTSA